MPSQRGAVQIIRQLLLIILVCICHRFMSTDIDALLHIAHTKQKADLQIASLFLPLYHNDSAITFVPSILSLKESPVLWRHKAQ